MRPISVIELQGHSPSETARFNAIEEEIARLLAPLALAERIYIESWAGARLPAAQAVQLATEFNQQADAFQLRIKSFVDTLRAEALQILRGNKAEPAPESDDNQVN